MNLQITQATESDLLHVHQYMAKIFDLQLNGLSRRPNGFALNEPKEYLPEQADSREKLCALAYVDHRIVGQLAFTRYPKPEYSHGGKFGMSVHPDYWRQGIGRALLDYLDSWAVNVGVTKLDLEVWASNTGAICLYECHGYLHEGRRRGSIIRDDTVTDLILMGKQLSENIA